jgi:MFS family permease
VTTTPESAHASEDELPGRAESTRGRPNPLRLLAADRNSRLYLAGRLVTAFGDAALCLTVGVWVTTLSGSSSAAGLVFFAFAVGTLCSPFGAIYVDRIRRRPLLICLNVLTALLVLLLMAAHTRHDLWLIYTVMMGYGLTTSTGGSAGSALLQLVLPKDALVEAIGLLQTAAQILLLTAPLLTTALLVKFGPSPAIALDAASFLIAAITVSRLRLQEAEPSPPAGSFLADALSGIRHICASQALRRVTLTCVFAVCAIGLQETVVFSVVREGLHRSPAFVAVLSTVDGIGAAAAGTVTASFVRRYGSARTRRVGLGIVACGFCLQSTGSLPATLLGCFLTGAGLCADSISAMSVITLRTPPEMMGRTSAAFTLALALPQTLFIAVGAELQAFVDYPVILLSVAGILAATAVWLRPGAEERYSASP